MNAAAVDVTPVDLEAEAAVLGAAMLGHPEALDGLTRTDFTDARHQDVLAAAGLVHAQGQPCDPVTVLAMLRRLGTLPSTADRGAASFLFDLAQAAPTPTAAMVYRQAVSEATLRRRIATAFERIAQAASEDSLPSLLRLVDTELEAIAEARRRPVLGHLQAVTG